MRRVWKALVRRGTDVVLAAGAALVAVGAGMIYLPAGLIAGGALTMAALGGGGET